MSLFAALNEPRLRFAEMLARKGIEPGRDLSQLYADALATRRCVFCKAKAQCDAWLASGRDEGLEEFCRNAYYLEWRGR